VSEPAGYRRTISPALAGAPTRSRPRPSLLRQADTRLVRSRVAMERRVTLRSWTAADPVIMSAGGDDQSHVLHPVFADAKPHSEDNGPSHRICRGQPHIAQGLRRIVATRASGGRHTHSATDLGGPALDGGGRCTLAETGPARRSATWGCPLQKSADSVPGARWRSPGQPALKRVCRAGWRRTSL
jgi:hypothetical protein